MKEVRINTGMIVDTYQTGKKTVPIDNAAAAIRNLVSRGYIKKADGKNPAGYRCQVWIKKGKGKW